MRVEGVNDTRATTGPLEWSDPPARHVGIWFDLLAPLVEQPRRWALVRVFELPGTAHSTARDLRRRRVNYQPGAWEFRTRRKPNGGTGLWARYLGPA